MKTPSQESMVSAADALSRLARSVDGSTTTGRSFAFYEKELLEVAAFLKSLISKEAGAV